MKLNPFENHIGLDISDFKIRFFQFHRIGSTKTKINSFSEIAVPKGMITSGEIMDQTKVSELLKQLFDKPQYGKPDSNYVHLSLPEKKIFLKTFTVPSVPDNELAGAVKWGIEQNVPVVMDEVYFDWQLLSGKNKKNKKKKEKKDSEKNNENHDQQLRIFTSVAPKNLVDSYSALLKKINLVPISMENESIAIARCLIDQSANITYPLILLDLGKSRTNLMIYQNNALQYTSTIEVSGNEMTEIISKTMKLSTEDAEKAKIICGLDKRKARGNVYKVLEPIVQRLIMHIRENVDYYDSYIGTKQKAHSILLTGSVSRMMNLTQFLQKELGYTCLIGDPWTNITRIKNKNEKYSTDFFSYTTAIGLALRRFD